jgi:hypothetical protein
MILGRSSWRAKRGLFAALLVLLSSAFDARAETRCEELRRLGDRALSTASFEEAVIHFEHLLLVCPSEPAAEPVRLELVRLTLDLGRLDVAARLAADVIGQCRASPAAPALGAVILLAEAHASRDDWESVLRLTEASYACLSLGGTPGDEIEIMTLAGKAYVELGWPGYAAASFERADDVWRSRRAKPWREGGHLASSVERSVASALFYLAELTSTGIARDPPPRRFAKDPAAARQELLAWIAWRLRLRRELEARYRLILALDPGISGEFASLGLLRIMDLHWELERELRPLRRREVFEPIFSPCASRSPGCEPFGDDPSPLATLRELAKECVERARRARDASDGARRCQAVLDRASGLEPLPSPPSAFAPIDGVAPPSGWSRKALDLAWPALALPG